MNKKGLRALRRPFIKELFRNNKFNFAMTLLAAFIVAASVLITSWQVKEVPDLIAGESRYNFGTLLLVAAGAMALAIVAWLIDRSFLTRFRAKAMKQYREYVFDRLMEKGIQAFSGESSSLYISALSNDVNTIERDFVGLLQRIVTVAIAFVGALALMLWFSPLLTNEAKTPAIEFLH